MVQSERLALDPDKRAGRAAFVGLEERLRLAFDEQLLGAMDEITERMALIECQLDERHAEHLRAVKAAAARQSAALRDVLAFLQSSLLGEVRVKRRPIDLRTLCERVLDAIHMRHPDRSIALMSRARVSGEWDPDLVAELLTNLVVNAVEHGRGSKTVRVSLRAAEDGAVIEVQSAGKLDDQVVDHLFEPFNRGCWTRPGEAGGLGLGLCLANEIARAHGGRIDFRSDRAKETTFRVTLPRA
jgi:signal transduction histidine kinase